MKRMAAVVTALVALTACGEDGTDRDDAGRSDDRTSDVSGYEFDAATQAEAQEVLDRAEDQVVASRSVHATAAWSFKVMSVEFDYVVDLAGGRSHQVMDYATGQGLVRVESVVDEEYLYSFMSQGSTVMPCWTRLSTPTREAFVPAVVLMTLDPVARGFATEGPEGGVVVELLLDEAVAAAMPKLAGQRAVSIDPTSTIDAIVTVVDGRFASVRYRLADVIDAVTSGGSEIPELAEFADLLGPEHEVAITYESYDTEGPVALPDGPFADLDAAAAGDVDPDSELVCNVA